MKRAASVGKNVFIVVSMLGWLVVGAALIYLSPAIAHALLQSERTAVWMETLGRSDYNPELAIAVGGVTFVAIVVATVFWNWRYEPEQESSK